MSNEEIKEMLYAIMDAYNGFDGEIKGLMLINHFILNLPKEEQGK